MDTTAGSYYLIKNGKQTGPFETAGLLHQLAAGTTSVNDLCRQEGMENWIPIAEVPELASPKSLPQPIPATPANADGEKPLFLYVPVSRLIVLSIVSCSLYEWYWIYRNWKYLKERYHLDISPFWRGFFGVFFCHDLLCQMHDDHSSQSVQTPSFSPRGLATGWVILMILGNLTARVPGVAASLLAAFIPSFLCLVPVQNYVNTVTKKRNPQQHYYPWSKGHILCLVYGTLIWLCLLIDLFVD